MLVHLLSKVCIGSGKGGGLFFGAGLKTIFFLGGGAGGQRRKNLRVGVTFLLGWGGK